MYEAWLTIAFCLAGWYRKLVMHRKLARSRDCSTGLLDQLSDNTKVDIASAASEEFMPEFETIDCAVQMQPRAIA